MEAALSACEEHSSVAEPPRPNDVAGTATLRPAESTCTQTLSRIPLRRMTPEEDQLVQAVMREYTETLARQEDLALVYVNAVREATWTGRIRTES